MPSAPEVRGVRRFLGMRLVLAANALVLCLVIWAFGGEFLRNRELQLEIDKLQTQADTLQAKNVEATHLSDHFAESGIIEREARTKLGLQKPGESVIIVRDVTPLPEGKMAVKPGTTVEPPLSNPQKWWRYFFH